MLFNNISFFLIKIFQYCLKIISGGNLLPFVYIDLLPTDVERKKSLIEEITKAFVNVKYPAERVHIVIHEISSDNIGIGGEVYTNIIKRRLK